MLKREKWSILVLVLVICLSVVGCSSKETQDSQSQEKNEEKEEKEVPKKEWKYAHIAASPEEIQYIFADKLAEGISSDTSVNVKVFPAGQLGGQDEQVDGIRTGNIQMAQGVWSALARFVPDLALFDAPYIFRDGKHAMNTTNPNTSTVLDDLNKQLIDKAGIRIIGGMYRGARHLSTSDFPVYSPDDLKGKKIRGIPNKIWTNTIIGMGAVPTPIEWAEVQTALMTGVVEGQENPLATLYDFKLYEVQNYASLTGHMQAVTAVYVNEEAWQSLTAVEREATQSHISDLSNESIKWAAERTESMKGKLEEKGMTIIGEEDGLDIEAFRSSVSAQIAQEFPEWVDYIEQIQEIK